VTVLHTTYNIQKASNNMVYRITTNIQRCIHSQTETMFSESNIIMPIIMKIVMALFFDNFGDGYWRQALA